MNKRKLSYIASKKLVDAKVPHAVICSAKDFDPKDRDLNKIYGVTVFDSKGVVVNDYIVETECNIEDNADVIMAMAMTTSRLTRCVPSYATLSF